MPDVGKLDRTLDTLTLGLIGGKDDHDKQLAFSAAGEMEQQVRVALSGEAANGWGFVDTPVAWEFPFLAAPAQRSAPYGTPHFSYGIELRSGTQELVVIHAHVVSWKIDPSSWVTGAIVRFASSAPMLEEKATVNYSAIAHLTFQGFACESEEGEGA